MDLCYNVETDSVLMYVAIIDFIHFKIIMKQEIMTVMSKVRTRFAPSPTGRMHVGNLRTALYTYLIANMKMEILSSGLKIQTRNVL